MYLSRERELPLAAVLNDGFREWLSRDFNRFEVVFLVTDPGRNAAYETFCHHALENAIGASASADTSDTIALGKVKGTHNGVARPPTTCRYQATLIGSLTLNIVNATTQFNLGGHLSSAAFI